MARSSKLWLGSSSLLVLPLLASTLLLSNCGKVPLPGGTNVAANTQVGKENVQQVVAKQERVTAGRDVVTQTKQVEAAQVDAVTINNVQDIPIWLWIALVVGWVLPSPQEIVRSIVDAFRGRR